MGGNLYNVAKTPAASQKKNAPDTGVGSEDNESTRKSWSWGQGPRPQKPSKKKNKKKRQNLWVINIKKKKVGVQAAACEKRPLLAKYSMQGGEKWAKPLCHTKKDIRRDKYR